jgi:CheY-like chemotaxis protein
MEAAKPRILCLDDQPEILQVRKFVLEQFGCEVVTVTDSAACLRLAVGEHFDLVMLDYHLDEEVTGEDVARKMAVLLPGTPLILVTGDPKIPKSARASVDAVLVKGAIGPAELLDAIQRLLPGSRIKPQRQSMAPLSNSRIS